MKHNLPPSLREPRPERVIFYDGWAALKFDQPGDTIVIGSNSRISRSASRVTTMPSIPIRPHPARGDMVVIVMQGNRTYGVGAAIAVDMATKEFWQVPEASSYELTIGAPADQAIVRDDSDTIREVFIAAGLSTREQYANSTHQDRHSYFSTLEHFLGDALDSDPRIAAAWGLENPNNVLPFRKR